MAVAGIVQGLSGEEGSLLYYHAIFFIGFCLFLTCVCTKAGQIFIQNLHAASVHQKVKSGGDVCRQNRFLHSVQLSQAVKKLSGNVPLH